MSDKPVTDMTEAELADYYHEHRKDIDSMFGKPEPAPRPGRERLDVTISVRFTSGELAEIRKRAEIEGMKATAYIRRCVLAAGEDIDLNPEHLRELRRAMREFIEVAVDTDQVLARLLKASHRTEHTSRRRA